MVTFVMLVTVLMILLAIRLKSALEISTNMDTSLVMKKQLNGNVSWFYMANEQYYDAFTLWLGRVCGYPSDFMAEIQLGEPIRARVQGSHPA